MQDPNNSYLDSVIILRRSFSKVGFTTIPKYNSSPTTEVTIAVDTLSEHVEVDLHMEEVSPYFSYTINGNSLTSIYADIKDILEQYTATETHLDITIGTDESGKGDFFGPLVIAGVAIDKSGEKELIKAGVKDSKQLSDNKVISLSRTIIDVAKKVKIVWLPPQQYNMRYEEVGNLNKLLEYGHLDVIRHLVASVPSCKTIVVDKFSNDTYLNMEIHRMCNVPEVLFLPKAESKYIAVAAASILARREFLRYMESMSEALNYDVPKGCGSNVLEAAKAIAWEKGIDVLDNYVKKHFVTYKKVEESLK